MISLTVFVSNILREIPPTFVYDCVRLEQTADFQTLVCSFLHDLGAVFISFSEVNCVVLKYKIPKNVYLDFHNSYIVKK